MTTYTVNTATALEAAFATASDGDRIELAAGTYETVTLSGRDFATGVTITSADPNDRAVLVDQITLEGVSGVTLTGIDVEADSLGTSTNYRRIVVSNSSDIALSDIDIQGHIPEAGEGVSATSTSTVRRDVIEGYGYDVGLQIVDSSDIDITEVEIFDTRTALQLARSETITVDDIDIHDTREGINMVDVDGVLIEDSHFHDLKPWKHDNGNVSDDHPDMIQFWGTNGVSGVHNITIQNNLFDQSGDDNVHTQTIYGNMSGADDDSVTATNFTITGNTIINGHLNAIALYDVTGALIADNVLLPLPNADDDPRQVETPGIVVIRGEDFEITGNTLLSYANSKPIQAVITDLSDGTIDFADDNVLLSTDPNDPLFWRTYGEITDEPEDDINNLDDLLAIWEASGIDVQEGSEDNDVLTGASDGSLMIGNGGNDRFREKSGDDIMVGGDGADQFVFDLRGNTDATTDVIADLDFGEGDYIRVITSTSGAFTAAEAISADNSLSISGDGSDIYINSAADLQDLIDAGAVETTIGGVSDLEGVVLSFDVAPDRLLDLAFYDIV